MSIPPVPCVFDGEVFRPLPNFLRVAREHYGAGEVVGLVPHEERSRKSHNHYFATVEEAWQNLPEHLSDDFPNADALRAHALIRTGHCTSSVVICMFKTEALRLATAMSQLADYSMVTVDGKVVTRFVAMSQSLRAMGKERFQVSKDDVLGFLADLIGVAPQALPQAQAA